MEHEKFMTQANVDHPNTLKINKFYLKLAFRSLTGELDTREATGQIAPSPKKLKGANGGETLRVLLGLKPFTGEREQPTGDGLPIVE